MSFKNVFIMPNITPITDGSLTACIPLNLSGAASYCHNHNKERFLYTDLSSRKIDIRHVHSVTLTTNTRPHISLHQIFEVLLQGAPAYNEQFLLHLSARKREPVYTDESLEILLVSPAALLPSAGRTFVQSVSHDPDQHLTSHQLDTHH